MNLELSNELYWLVATILMTSLLWVPYILNRMHEQGIFNAIWDPQGHTETKKDWARRMMQAHENAVENLVIFAPLVILVQVTGFNSEVTASACMLYFFTRMVHYLAFTFAVPVVRVVTFLIGFGVQLILALTLLGL